jgi:signal transduction histidine kinase
MLGEWPAFLSRAVRVARSAPVGYLAAVLLPVVVLFVVGRLGLPAFVFEHVIVLLVVACAVWWGLRPAVATAVVAVFADNVLLQEPVGQPAITGARDAIDLALFTLVAVCVGWLVASTRLQRARAETAANRERRAREDRDRLIATISHDLATPLNAIRGSIRFAQRFGDEARVDLDRLLERLDTASVACDVAARDAQRHAGPRPRRAVTRADTRGPADDRPADGPDVRSALRAASRRGARARPRDSREGRRGQAPARAGESADERREVFPLGGRPSKSTWKPTTASPW